jgi:hypothetical protein
MDVYPPLVAGIGVLISYAVYFVVQYRSHRLRLEIQRDYDRRAFMLLREHATADGGGEVATSPAPGEEKPEPFAEYEPGQWR